MPQQLQVEGPTASERIHAISLLLGAGDLCCDLVGRFDLAGGHAADVIDRAPDLLPPEHEQEGPVICERPLGAERAQVAAGNRPAA